MSHFDKWILFLVVQNTVGLTEPYNDQLKADGAPFYFKNPSVSLPERLRLCSRYGPTSSALDRPWKRPWGGTPTSGGTLLRRSRPSLRSSSSRPTTTTTARTSPSLRHRSTSEAAPSLFSSASVQLLPFESCFEVEVERAHFFQARASRYPARTSPSLLKIAIELQAKVLYLKNIKSWARVWLELLKNVGSGEPDP